MLWIIKGPEAVLVNVSQAEVCQQETEVKFVSTVPYSYAGGTR